MNTVNHILKIQFKVLVNQLQLVCGCHHFEARHGPHAFEVWCNLTQAVCVTHLKQL